MPAVFGISAFLAAKRPGLRSCLAKLVCRWALAQHIWDLNHALLGGGFTPTNAAPVVHNYDAAFADDGTFTYSLQISLPTDLDGDTLSATIDQVPTYGIVEYFDSGSSSFVQVTGGETLTADQLTTLQYTPDASGEHGGGSVVYTVSDGIDSTTGTIEINDVAEEDVGPPFPVLFFSAQGPSPPRPAPICIWLDPFGICSPCRCGADFTQGDPSPDSGSRAGEDGGFVHFAGNLLFFADVFDGTSVVSDQLMVKLGGAPFSVSSTELPASRAAMHILPSSCRGVVFRGEHASTAPSS